ncbi:MAG: ATP-binding protein [Candidatus Magasanikbacteria bacterium]|nr:ATP-binding protein [Candidatus Magasanikbacteria bacterium]
MRKITQKAVDNFSNKEIMLFIGARQAGKTTILKQLKEAVENKKQQTHFLNLEDPDFLTALNQSPKNLFKILPLNETRRSFVFIDEVQYLKNPTNFLKYLHDEHGDRIKLIVSGSSAFYLDQKFKDSLVGRKKIFFVRTLSFREFLLFKNEPELAKKDFASLAETEKDRLRRHYDEYLIYGGYPRVVLASDNEEKKEILREIVYSYIKKDIYESGVRQDEEFYKLLKILASQTGQLVNRSELAGTLRMSAPTVDHYFYILQKSFHLCLIKPFHNNIRKELTKMPKVFFYDLGLRNFLLNDFSMPSLRSDKGTLIENAVFRQLLEYYFDDEIKFWRTADGQEVDFILPDNRALEAKFDASQFKSKKYAKFLENYPQYQLSVAAYAVKEGRGAPLAREIWAL